jgi:hypothetical protein
MLHEWFPAAVERNVNRRDCIPTHRTVRWIMSIEANKLNSNTSALYCTHAACLHGQ